MKKKYLLILSLILSSCFAWGAQKRGTPRTFFKGVSKIKDPFSLRDPFQGPQVKRKTQQNETQSLLRDGVYTNLPAVPQMNLDDYEIIGVVVGKQRRAIARSRKDKNRTFVLKEGMKLGQEGAELKAILPGGVVVVEKITNIYGQDEYLETVIPISK